MLKRIKFFQEREIPSENYLLLAKALRYEFGRRGEIVFEKGSIGDTFYIILQGKVGKKNPSIRIKSYRSLRPQTKISKLF